LRMRGDAGRREIVAVPPEAATLGAERPSERDRGLLRTGARRLEGFLAAAAQGKTRKGGSGGPWAPAKGWSGKTIHRHPATAFHDFPPLPPAGARTSASGICGGGPGKPEGAAICVTRNLGERAVRRAAFSNSPRTAPRTGVRRNRSRAAPANGNGPICRVRGSDRLRHQEDLPQPVQLYLKLGGTSGSSIRQERSRAMICASRLSMASCTACISGSTGRPGPNTITGRCSA